MKVINQSKTMAAGAAVQQSVPLDQSIANTIIHVHTTYNNTIVSFSDTEGNILSSSSGGNAGFKGARRNTAYAAQCAAELAAKKYFKKFETISSKDLAAASNAYASDAKAKNTAESKQQSTLASGNVASARATSGRVATQQKVQSKQISSGSTQLQACVVKLCGFGKGREAALRGLISSGIKINKIMDVTPIAHNGCKPPKKRRL